MPPAPPARVGFLLIDDFALMSFASAVEPLRAANSLTGRRLYEWLILTVDGREIERLEWPDDQTGCRDRR